jgi:glycosyltransferase involved in cell wall biosynthesis
MISLITCTGGRPKALELLRQCVLGQWWYGPIQWIVVNDVERDFELSFSKDDNSDQELFIEYVRPNPKWEPGQNTYRRNLKEALDKVKGQYIFFLEDDEYYHSSYLSFIMASFRNYDYPIVGLNHLLQYHLPTRTWLEKFRITWPALCATAIKASHLQHVYDAVEREGNTDHMLYQIVQERGTAIHLAPNGGLVVGLKGTPGRPGITPHHKTGYFNQDPTGAKLKQWIGSAAEDYLSLIKGIK